MRNYLNRGAAGIPESLWERIDKAAQQAAADILTARRFLDLEGPFGVGQDLEVGYSANDGIHHKLFVSESLVLVLSEPGAISTLVEA